MKMAFLSGIAYALAVTCDHFVDCAFKLFSGDHTLAGVIAFAMAVASMLLFFKSLDWYASAKKEGK